MNSSAKILWIQISKDSIQGIDGSISLLKVLSVLSSSKFPFKTPQLLFSASILSGEKENIKKQELIITNESNEVLYSKIEKNIPIPKDNTPLNATDLIPSFEIEIPGNIFIQFKITFDDDVVIDSNKLEICVVEVKPENADEV